MLTLQINMWRMAIYSSVWDVKAKYHQLGILFQWLFLYYYLRVIFLILLLKMLSVVTLSEKRSIMIEHVLLSVFSSVWKMYWLHVVASGALET